MFKRIWLLRVNVRLVQILNVKLNNWFKLEIFKLKVYDIYMIYLHTLEGFIESKSRLKRKYICPIYSIYKYSEEYFEILN